MNLPGPGESGVRDLDSRFARVDPDADPRPGARAWVRTRADREARGGDAASRLEPADRTAVFVAVYAHHERDSGDSERDRATRYVNVAVPLPWSNLSTVLRPENRGDGLELTTLDAAGDEGLYLATPLGSVALPLDQRFRVRPADERDAGSSARAPNSPRASSPLTRCGCSAVGFSRYATRVAPRRRESAR